MLKNKENKTKLLKNLPFEVGCFGIRELEREDIDVYANWPDYPLEYSMFNTSLKEKPLSERDKRWGQYCNSDNSVSLTIDYKDERVIGRFSLVEIDWEKEKVNNMSIRLHPQWCNSGNGAVILKVISRWCFNNGIKTIKFDVLSTNKRAIKSYKNAGFEIIDEFKRNDSVFYWMELSRK